MLQGRFIIMIIFTYRPTINDIPPVRKVQDCVGVQLL